MFDNEAAFLGMNLEQGIKFDNSNLKIGGSEQRSSEHHWNLGLAQKLFQSQLIQVETMTPLNNQIKNFDDFNQK